MMFHGALDLNRSAQVHCRPRSPHLLRAKAIGILNPAGPAFGLDGEMGTASKRPFSAPVTSCCYLRIGVIKALEAGGEEFGTDRLEDALANGRELPARQSVDKVLADVTAFSRGVEQFDDSACRFCEFCPEHQLMPASRPSALSE
jgi:hypothetical protein